MKTEKQSEVDHEFDFFKKNPVVQNIKKTKNKFLSKKESYSFLPKKKNYSVSLVLPKGFWAVLMAAIGLLGLSAHVEHAGWVLFLAFLHLDKKEGLIGFALATLGLLGLYHHVEFSGWLIFAAFIL